MEAYWLIGGLLLGAALVSFGCLVLGPRHGVQSLDHADEILRRNNLRFPDGGP